MTSPITEFSREHILAALNHLHEPGALIELRHKVGGGMVGHFAADPQRIAAIAGMLDGTTNVYVTLNPIKIGLAELAENSTTTTKNEDIAARRWLFVDFDPVRTTGTAATDAQFRAARDRARDCAAALKALGWPEPTAAYSGNGVHLLWAVDEGNSAATDALFRTFTEALAHRWGDADVAVDRVVHNAARIIKLWGTKSVKGDPTDAERPHRYSALMSAQPRVIVSEGMMRDVIAAWGKPRAVRAAQKGPDPDAAPTRGLGRPRKAAAPQERPAFDMGAWLARMGVDVREVALEADRTRFVLSNCVFDPTHGGKDAAVFLGADGQRGYHCFHDSCSRRTWADVRALFDPAYADRRAVTDGDLPTLQVNERRASDVVADVVRLLAQNNDPPTLFQSQGQLLTLRQAGAGLTLVPLTLDTLRVEAINRISFVQRRAGKEGVTFDAVWPARDLLQSVLSRTEWPGLPACDLVTQVPLVAPDGTIHSQQGYNPATRAYLTTDEYAFRRDPATVTREEALAARDWLMAWPLEGFPFVDAASRSHALAAMLQHSVSRVIAANTPLYLLDASRPGSGKGLLAEVVARAAGTLPRILALPVREEERQKTIVSTLLQRPTHVAWDNVKGQVDSPALEALLTAPTFSARLLGASENVDLPATGTCWMLTANNATFTPDLVTRAAYIRLEPECDDPTQRSDFRISNLSRWLTEHRAEVIGHVLTIIAHWVGRGMPSYSGERRHRLERWRDVMGGVLESVDLGDAFLSNNDELRDAADTETVAWEQFVAAWLDTHRTAVVRVRDLMDAAYGEVSDPIRGTRAEGTLDTLVVAHNDAQRRIRLGILLKGKHGAIYNSHRIVVKTDKKNGNLLHLERVGEPSSLEEQIDRIAQQRPTPPPREPLEAADVTDPAGRGRWDDFGEF